MDEAGLSAKFQNSAAGRLGSSSNCSVHLDSQKAHQPCPIRAAAAAAAGRTAAA